MKILHNIGAVITGILMVLFIFCSPKEFDAECDAGVEVEMFTGWDNPFNNVPADIRGYRVEDSHDRNMLTRGWKYNATTHTVTTAKGMKLQCDDFELDTEE